MREHGSQVDVAVENQQNYVTALDRYTANEYSVTYEAVADLITQMRPGRTEKGPETSQRTE